MFLPVIALVLFYWRLVLFTTMFFVWKKLGSTHSGLQASAILTIVRTNQHCVNIYCFIQSGVMISFLVSVRIFDV